MNRLRQRRRPVFPNASGIFSSPGAGRIRNAARLALFLGASASLLQAFPAAADICCACTVPETNGTTCLTSPGATTCADLLKDGNNAALKNVTCQTQPLTSTQCQSIATSNGGGICQAGPTAAFTFTPAGKDVSALTATSAFSGVQAPTLQQPIPGLTFRTDLELVGGKLRIPWIAQYVSALYRYLTGIGVIVAGVMVIYGGLQYLLGETVGSVKSGQKTITEALIGLAILLSAYLILNTLNPALVSPEPLVIDYVEPERLEIKTLDLSTFAQVVAGSGAPISTDANGQSRLTSGATWKDGPCDLQINPAGIPTVQSVYACGVLAAKELGIPACYAVVAINYESFVALPNSIGHDENAHDVGGVLPQARLNFLRSAKSSKGKALSLKVPAPASCNETNRAECTAAVNQNVSNDDDLDPAKADLGLDWRYSHGIGLMQFTLFNGPSRTIGGETFTAKQLFGPYAAVRAGLLTIKAAARGGTPGTDANAALGIWKAYAGSGSLDNANAAARAQAVAGCDNDRPLASISPKQFSICRGDLPLDRAACESVVKSAYPTADPKTACNRAFCDPRMPVICDGKGCRLR